MKLSILALTALTATTLALPNSFPLTPRDECTPCRDFFNKCTKSAWCWFNPNCTYSCSVDTCKHAAVCREKCGYKQCLN